MPDGEHKYYVVAVDKAGNISAISNTLPVSIETRAPRATITQPANNSKTEHRVILVATAVDQDIRTVQFQMKPEASAVWTPLGAAVTQAPYQTPWNTTALDYGNYQFRAVATDTHDNTDTAPPAITITLRDLTAPAAPTGLAVTVDQAIATKIPL